jgi:hypothetical protein
MFGNTDTSFGWDTYIILIVFAAIFAWSIYRRKRSGNIKVRSTIGLMADIEFNLRVMEARIRDWKTYKKFRTGEWDRYKDKIEFLSPAVRDSLNRAFTMAVDFNSRIDTARKNRSPMYLMDIQAESLRDPLTKSKSGIQAWLSENLQKELSAGRQRGGSV